MIVVKVKDGKWRISIQNEVWEIPTFATMRKVLSEILSNKESFGQLDDFQE